MDGDAEEIILIDKLDENYPPEQRAQSLQVLTKKLAKLIDDEEEDEENKEELVAETPSPATLGKNITNLIVQNKQDEDSKIKL